MNKIIKKVQYSEKVFRFDVEAPLIAKSRKAGNFVIIRVDNNSERNLKNYIEDILNGIAEDYEDAKLYAKLRKEQPEGLIRANKEEQEDFEKWLGV